MIYYPGEVGETPEHGNDRFVTYELRSLERLWSLQMEAAAGADSAVYHDWGSMRGDCSGPGHSPRCSTNTANLPWNWDDEDDEDDELYSGQYVLDPVYAIDHYFDDLGPFASTYLRNPYLEDLRAAGYSDGNLPVGWDRKLSLDQMLRRLPTS
ncbi:MAG: hypothetical protein AAF467_07210 [Actinomycetota bacterium]